ncbi:MAG TPA: septal ring lytic transglycosylase RlpA family protein [Fibrobacteria bacterium]|nr:septal ring lytic transglycosylase RlpA family protein [Fibrobacteria bacterium]
MRRFSVLLVLSVVFAGCGANLPTRTGYDRRTGTWKPAPGSKAKTPKSAPVAAVVAPQSAPDRDVTDSIAPIGTKIRGVASFYGKEFAGRPTSNGEPYDPDLLTCAHRTLPFGTRLKVDYPKKGLSTTVRVNDRGPHKDGRILDLSRAAADELGLTADGVGTVEAEVVP